MTEMWAENTKTCDKRTITEGDWMQTTTVTGTYTIVSPVKIWVLDAGEELGEAVGGMLAAAGQGLIGILLIIVGAILCCVSCCCMDKTPAGGGGAATGTVVGQPVA